MANVLVIAAHPDDEILGAGATMARHIVNGDQVTTLIVAEGVTSRSDQRNTEADGKQLEDLKKVAIEANKYIGVHNVKFLGLSDNRLDQYELLDVIKNISKVIGEVDPEIIYTHFDNDLNIDHRIVSQAVLTACRPQPGERVKEIFFFEVPSSTEWQSTTSTNTFNPNTFSDISNFLEIKLKSLNIYESEMRPWPHARSIKALEHLARYRGSSVGIEAAEAFMLVRQII
jgi:LmbE family N-acetylglucosaminyl deacetylase